METYLAHNPHGHPAAHTIDEVAYRYYPTRILATLSAAGVRVIPLSQTTTYTAASPALRRLTASVDHWPRPPAGLFVVEERTVYLRSLSSMTIVHELAHALDLALGGGVYLSGFDPAIRRAFRDARAFVTPYAASALDEYFAECVRAYVEANDPRSPWPRATRARLKALDPAMHAIVSAMFAQSAA
jgi:hypothetical protein